MLSVTIGPLALPLQPLAWLLALVAGAWLAGRLVRRTDPQAGQRVGDALWLAALAALLAGRLVHLLLHTSAYAGQPWAMLDVRDGGLHGPVAALTGAGFLVWRLRHQRAWWQPAAGGAALALAIVGAASVLAQRHAVHQPPELVLQDLQGAPVNVRSALHGQPAVLALWATWCGVCQRELPLLQQAQQRWPQVRVVYVNQAEAPALVQAHLATQAAPAAPVWLDTQAQLGTLAGSRALPTLLFYDAAGQLVGTHVGLLNAAALEVRLQSLTR
ncbi:TlpA family protein disulfide reductase [Ideonella sp. 4Y11]|uniref:TlpA family protein disulfide reductase n=1 Tax=Ideonella aquatica TaxID=2824119 RepID=A0A941BJV5_9BURK|nr:TlpA family protein disulfide reductase [Ideonella aquatica]MBQ0959877.1 TlpA family protein disulfide reductase [Ideonella aquatica]